MGYRSVSRPSRLRRAVANGDLLVVLDAASVAKRARGENFPVASLAFPRELRPHIRALYAYARLVDILGDELEGGPAARLTALDEPNEPLGRLLEFEAERARGLLASGDPLGRRIGGRTGRAVMAFARGGLAAVDALQRADFDVFTGRPKPSRIRLARTAVGALVR